MAEQDKDKILEKVDSNRRDFLRRVLGTSFAVPLIATFAIESLTSNMAQAQDNQNQFDNQFNAQLFEVFFRGDGGGGRQP